MDEQREDDREGNNTTYCETYFGNSPLNWDLEEKQNE